MTNKERSDLKQKIFEKLHTTENRTDFLLLTQAYEDEIIDLIFERQNLIHELNKFNNE